KAVPMKAAATKAAPTEPAATKTEPKASGTAATPAKPTPTKAAASAKPSVSAKAATPVKAAARTKVAAPTKAPAKASVPSKAASSAAVAPTDQDEAGPPVELATRLQDGEPSSAVVEDLLNKGRTEGFITHDQILEAIPQPEANLGAVEELYAAAEESGVEVLDADNNPTFADVEVEEEEVAGLAVKPREVEEDLEALAADLIGIDDPVRMYLKEIGKVALL